MRLFAVSQISHRLVNQSYNSSGLRGVLSSYLRYIEMYTRIRYKTSASNLLLSAHKGRIATTEIGIYIYILTFFSVKPRSHHTN